MDILHMFCVFFQCCGSGSSQLFNALILVSCIRIQKAKMTHQKISCFEVLDVVSFEGWWFSCSLEFLYERLGINVLYSNFGSKNKNFFNL
jgi:hypothetical protein